MPDITVTISDAAAARLQAKCDEHNARLGTKLAMPEYVDLHLREWLTQDDLPQEIEILQRQYDRQLQTAIVAKKNDLMATLAVAQPVAPVAQPAPPVIP